MNELLFPKNTKEINYENSLEICHMIVKQNYENFPIIMFFQKVSTVFPSGVIDPTPVITTLLLVTVLCFSKPYSLYTL